ncbi:hypothetical protein IHN63_00475 [Deinococcus sp. 6YEL10]|uniref:hypothetical protein n=1 Tax=Deinococcus sp. 6YEL10 TaxID=2745870 RepID=UPI001E4CFDE5|nr:hypothetical protein [Deinococcus sp. 6YEL10]MCD0159774.1 hypothetical protein [Deinococcus sp. 6YEL10]
MTTLHFDAGVRIRQQPSPDGIRRGKGAAAFVVEEDGQITHECVIALSDITVNEGEYTGLIAALDWVLTTSVTDPGHYTIIGDSMVAIQQFRGKEEGDPWQDDGGPPGFQVSAQAAHLRAYRDAARRRYAQIRALGSTVVVRHTLREGNGRADYLTQQVNDIQNDVPLRARPSYGPEYPGAYTGVRMNGYPVTP